MRSIVVRVSSTTSWSRPAAMVTASSRYRQEIGDGQGVNQVGFPRMADLSPVLEGREDVGASEQFDVSVRAVRPNFFEEVFEANHGNRCLNQY
jgi:hypothetical protein